MRFCSTFTSDSQSGYSFEHSESAPSHQESRRSLRFEVQKSAHSMVAVITERPAHVAETSRDVGSVPLCVDLDGTLIKSDSLWESALILLKRDWLKIFSFPLWLLRGRARFKHEIAERAEINAASLPYNEALVERLRAEHRSGRELVLVT